MLYFMIVNDTHHGNALVTNLGGHDNLESAVKFAEKKRELCGLGFGYEYKIYGVVGNLIEEMDVHENFNPPIPVLQKGQTSIIDTD